MGFTKKKLTHISERRNPDQRRLWWECPPPVGVKGVPTGTKEKDISTLMNNSHSFVDFLRTSH
jgi:hypothetical protein